MIPRLLSRYVAREVAVPFVFGLAIFTFVPMMFLILRITEAIVNYGIKVGDVLLAMAYTMPPLLVFTVPMAFLLAVILAVGRLSSDSELVAMKAAGVSLNQLLPPIVAVAIVAYLAASFLSLVADPWGKQKSKRLLFDLGSQNATIALKPQVFNDQFEKQGLILYVDEIDPKERTLKGVFIADNRDQELPNIVTADRGRLISKEDDLTLVIQLEDGTIHRTLRDERAYETASFERYDMTLNFAESLDAEEYKKTYLEMSLSELSAYIDRLRESGEDQYTMRRARVEFHRKFAFPFACVVFAILGIPLGVVPPRSGRGQGFTFAIVALCVYYLLFRVGENLGWKGVAPPWVVMWTPNVLYLLLGLWWLRLKSQERPIAVLEWIGAAQAAIKRRFKKHPTEAAP
ncbi:MAG: LPS export ABC transporter permease LptF [Deltaproteobacteria bacterium]|nr:LPS export ABC transporter permease LptF [bacterium]MCB9477929.1 LPS export ABC transporter permease LptF [Deltaproteobacteria bacterium]MCB9488192.1 LPS export ABC transporter permease LptF [Deltaproteobacteria bacterium]